MVADRVYAIAKGMLAGQTRQLSNIGDAADRNKAELGIFYSISMIQQSLSNVNRSIVEERHAKTALRLEQDL